MAHDPNALLDQLPPRDRFAAMALQVVPHLAMLVDRNPYSPTYGCFDREYWHYRTLDFPCGMSQEFVLPFAQLYAHAYPGNRYHRWERMREIAVAGIRFAMRSARPDGTCDDYYPYERAMGALAFSTFAATEAYRLLQLDEPEIVAFFLRRGDHLAAHDETGRLSNHQALAALTLCNIHLITGDDTYRRAAQSRVERALSWQHPEEGWFQEYEGADPGYHTCSLSFLAKYMQRSGDTSLVEPLTRAVDFAWHFMHPDGSYGGEYGSRNTYHYYPHGFEVMAPHSKKAAWMNDMFLEGAARGKRYQLEDDRMCCHLVYDWLHAWEDYHPERADDASERRPAMRWMPEAGLAVVNTPRYYAVAAMKKGGVVKAYDADRCIGSDTGLIGRLDDGGVLVTHLQDEQHRVDADPELRRFRVEGVFSRRSSKLSSPMRQIAFRLINITLGRFAPNLVRFLLQKLLITGKKRTAFRFARTIAFDDAAITIEDELPDAVPFESLSAGADATSIYVAASNPYQEAILRRPWMHAPDDVVAAARRGDSRWARRIAPETREP